METTYKTASDAGNSSSVTLETIKQEIFDYCNQSLEGLGMIDAANNPDLLHRNLNIEKITAGFKSLIEHRLPYLKGKIGQFDEVIINYTRYGMVNSAAPYETKRDEHVHMREIMNEFLNDEVVLERKLHYVLLSYQIGFNNGLRAYNEKF